MVDKSRYQMHPQNKPTHDPCAERTGRKETFQSHETFFQFTDTKNLKSSKWCFSATKWPKIFENVSFFCTFLGRLSRSVIVSNYKKTVFGVFKNNFEKLIFKYFLSENFLSL